MNDTSTDATTPAEPEQVAGFWTKAEAAAYLSVPPHTIDYLCRTKQLAYHLVAGKRRFLRSDLDAYGKSTRVGVAS